MSMYINISYRQLAEPGFSGKVKDLLDRYGVPPRIMVFEIAENSLVRHFDAAEMEIHHLTGFGLGFSLDDFGTGYSSLSALQSLPIRAVKLGVGLIGDIGKDVRVGNVVRAIISLCHGLSLQVVAGGVETEAQLTLLRDIECDCFQGYLFGGPATVEALELELRAQAQRKIS